MADTFEFTLDEDSTKRLYDILTDFNTEKVPSFTITDKYGHTAEYVKVVRCKDCERFEQRSKYGHGLCHIHCNGVGQCEVVTKMFYCGYPERKDNA